MAQRLVPSLPRIKVPIGHIPQRLKAVPFESPRGRIEVLRQFLTRLVREERCEMKYNRAEELRPYVERFIQLGVHRGLDDEYTKEMYDWWLLEKDLLDKMKHVLIPRFTGAEEPYTNLFRLQFMQYQSKVRKHGAYHVSHHVGVIEIKGNPFPPIDGLESERVEAMYEFVRNRLKIPSEEPTKPQ
uniref:Large ribosomal subunit protein bL17m n=1 Tax=Panagrolaimus sp. JU765 TaxID=591449 RepID=A0AC34Q2A6_9BILA